MARRPFGIALLLACANCVPPRTLIIQTLTNAGNVGGVTYPCDAIDVSQPGHQKKDTCRRDARGVHVVVNNSNPKEGGVPDNWDNTRNVYVEQCDQIFDVRIYDPNSDHPRITVTCAKSPPPPAGTNFPPITPTPPTSGGH